MNEEQQIWLCALRYGLGRATYITSTISEFLISKIPEMSQKTKNLMIFEIEECKNLGMDCDKKSWIKLLNNLKK